MKPDYERSATAAMETLLSYKIDTAPILPLPIFKHTRGVLTLSFAEVSRGMGMDRKDAITMFGSANQDAVTTVHVKDGRLRYVVTYNQRLPFFVLQRALARELGHIVLGHDGSRPDNVRTEEALCFAHHLLCPRPLVKAVQDSGVKLSIEVLGNMTGCYEKCLAGMQKLPGVKVPVAINRAVREQFSDYLDNFISYQRTVEDPAAPVDFGSYMELYEE